MMGALGGMGALSSLAGGGGGKGGGGGSGGSNLGALFGAATGQNQKAMENRYRQLGLASSDPSSPNQQDIGALGTMGLAAAQPLEQQDFQNQLALGQLQNTAQANLGGAAGLQQGFTQGGTFG